MKEMHLKAAHHQDSDNDSQNVLFMNFLPQEKAFVMGKEPKNLKAWIDQAKLSEEINQTYAVQINHLSSTMEQLAETVNVMTETNMVATREDNQTSCGEYDHFRYVFKEINSITNATKLATLLNMYVPAIGSSA